LRARLIFLPPPCPGFVQGQELHPKAAAFSPGLSKCGDRGKRACGPREESQEASAALFEKLASRDPILEKEAIDAVNNSTRKKIREDRFFRRIILPVPIDNDKLDRQVSTGKPVKVANKEQESPAAISIPFATLPINLYIRGPRYRVMLDRVVTPRFTKDTDELRTGIMDIRQVLSDNAVKDMLAEAAVR
jgi:hypothetical protein